MEKDDLETYQAQLAQVDAALSSDPDNTELSSLKSELQELIELTKATLAQLEETVQTRLGSTIHGLFTRDPRQNTIVPLISDADAQRLLSSGSQVVLFVQ